MTLYDLYILMGCDDKERLEVYNETTNKTLIKKNKRFFIFTLDKKPEEYTVTKLSFSRKYVEVKELLEPTEPSPRPPYPAVNIIPDAGGRR